MLTAFNSRTRLRPGLFDERLHGARGEGALEASGESRLQARRGQSDGAKKAAELQDAQAGRRGLNSNSNYQLTRESVMVFHFSTVKNPFI